jgi:stage II sporulation protein D
MKRRLATRALTVLLVALALPATASGAVRWIVHGAGFGHGVGIGAYGAYGYGRNGFGYQQIVKHYFNGIAITRLDRGPLVRVLLAVRSGDVGFSGATAACGQTLTPSRFYRAHLNGTSVRLLSASGRPLGRCGGRLHADTNGRIRISGVGTYRGALNAVPGGSGSLNVINELNVNNYAKGVLPSEVPASWPTATLQAFAVAARSIGLSTDVGGEGFQLYPDTRTQVYGGLEAETARTNQAVDATSNRVATYGGKVIQTFYMSSSGGQTESGFLGAPKVPYLKSVTDPYDYYSPQHRWTFHFSEASIDARLGAYLKGKLLRVNVTQRGDSPRINYAQLAGSRGTTTIRGDTLAAALGLYDRWAYFKKLP